jgi:hypothetical protein
MKPECRMHDRRKVSSVFETMTADRINRNIYTNLKTTVHLYCVMQPA